MRTTKAARHRFYYKITDTNGKERLLSSAATVRIPKKEALLTLTAADVANSIERDGVGNTQTCSMAVCANRQAEAFSHDTEGFIDWTYSRAYVVSKVNRSGLPSECYVYSHNDSIARMNDSPGGQRKLLAELTKNGSRSIRLIPERGVGAHGPFPLIPSVRTGERAKRSAKGAKARFAFAHLGGAPK